MLVRSLVILLALSNAGCLHPDRSPKPGSNYVSNSGEWIEIGADGKAHKEALPLDQVPAGMLKSAIP